MSAATSAGAPSLADQRVSGKMVDKFGKQGCVSAGQDRAIAFEGQALSLPVGNAAPRTFHNRNERPPVPWIHGAFRNDVDLPKGEEAVSVAVSAPGRAAGVLLQMGKPRRMTGGHDFRCGAREFGLGGFRAGTGANGSGKTLGQELRGSSRNTNPALPGHRLVDQPEHGTPLVKERNERAEGGAAGQEGAGTINGIENPQPVSVRAAHAIFLTENGVFRQALCENVSHGLFCLPVGNGDGTVIGFCVRAQGGSEIGQDSLAGDVRTGRCCVDGSLHHGFIHDLCLFPSCERCMRLTPVVAGGIRGAMHPIIVIPSRLASTRLPRKPLADIGGVPMIVRVVRQALAAQIGPVVVAAGDEEILEAIRGIPDVKGVLTDSELASGSDRVHAALAEVDPDGAHDVVINLQGDLPLIAPSSLVAVLKPLEDPAFDIGTLAAPVTSDAERDAPQVVKIACDFKEADVARALYFSRLPIPWGIGPHWHHVGVYAWRRAALERFVTLAPSALERRESLEQLRALQAGMAIGCARIDHAPQGVDTPADLEHVRGLV